MSRKLGRREGSAVEEAESRREETEGWPARRLKGWPVAVDFGAVSEKLKRIRMMGYQKVVGSVQVLFTDDTMTQVLGRLQDYCFQQGAMTNANPRDRAFFMSCLAHDLVFFEGDQGRPIVDDMPLDEKIYDALPHMRASHYDLYRIERRSLLGRVEASSLLRDARVEYQAGPFGGARVGDWVLGRVVSLGRTRQMMDPWLKLSESHANAVKKVFEEELEACRERHAGLRAESLLKVAGYHLYEEVVARMLWDELEAQLPAGTALRPKMMTFTLAKRRDAPDLSKLSRARVAEEDEAGRASLVLVDLAPSSGIHRSVREAMVTIEGQEVIVVAFLAQGITELVGGLAESLPAGTARRDEALSPLEVYRSLRHTVKGRAS